MAGERTLPGLGLRAYWEPGSDGWNEAFDPDFRKLSALVQCSVESRQNTLPGSPEDGVIYIAPSGSGTNANRIAARDNGSWVYFDPQEGWLVWVKDEDKFVVWNGTAWTVLQTGGSGGGIPEAPTDGKQYGRQNGDWTEIVQGEGGEVGPVTDTGHFGFVQQSGNTPLTGGQTVDFGDIVEDTAGAWNATAKAYIIPPALDGEVVLFTFQTQALSDTSTAYEIRIDRSTDNGATWVRVGHSPNAGLDYFGIGHAFALVRVAQGERYRAFVSSSAGTASNALYTHFKYVSFSPQAVTPPRPSVVAVTASRALQTSDAGCILESTGSGAVTVTIPADLTVNFPVGTQINVARIGTGAVTVSAASGVSLNGIGEGECSIETQWGIVALYKRAAGAWVVSGAHGGVS